MEVLSELMAGVDGGGVDAFEGEMEAAGTVDAPVAPMGVTGVDRGGADAFEGDEIEAMGAVDALAGPMGVP